MNWKNIIQDLIDSGMTQAGIGSEIGRSQGFVGDLLSGRRTGIEWEAGNKLLSLHKERCIKAA